MIVRWRWVAVAFCATGGAHAACFVATFTLSFGAVSPLSRSTADSIGQISVTCSDVPGAPIRYALSLSAGVAGSFAPRKMTSIGSTALRYNLYLDAARTIVWGDGNVGTVNVADVFALAAPTVTKYYAVYGRIFAGQNVPPGVYGDSILISLEF